MTDFQRVIKYLAIIFAVGLIVAIFSGILGGLSLLTYVFDNDAETGAATTDETLQLNGVYELDIELSSFELVIKTGDALAVDYDSRNKIVEVDDNKLKITEKNKKFNIHQEGYSVVLTVPEDYFFTKVSIKMGAGRLTVERLNTNELELELGASDVDIRNLTAITSVDIEGGAGELSVTDSQITDLDLDMGVGELRLESQLIGNNNINLGVGSSEIILKGTDEDYRLDVTKGLGAIYIDGKEYKNTDTLSSVVRGDSAFVKLNCSVGSVNIEYK